MYSAIAENSGTSDQTTVRDAARICSMRAPCLRPIACDRLEVSPVEIPTQQAVIRISYGNDRPPTAAIAASPRVDAKAMSTKVNSDRIPNDSTSGAAIIRIDVRTGGTGTHRPGPDGCDFIEGTAVSRPPRREAHSSRTEESPRVGRKRRGRSPGIRM